MKRCAKGYESTRRPLKISKTSVCLSLTGLDLKCSTDFPPDGCVTSSSADSESPNLKTPKEWAEFNAGLLPTSPTNHWEEAYLRSEDHQLKESVTQSSPGAGFIRDPPQAIVMH